MREKKVENPAYFDMTEYFRNIFALPALTHKEFP